MGETENGHLRLEFRGAKATTDAGLLVVREPDESPGPTAMAGVAIKEKRTGKNIGHQLEGPLKSCIHKTFVQCTTHMFMGCLLEV